MGYLVTRRIEFCYGHRLLNYEGKCAKLHGHNATAELVFAKEELDQRSMVLDFADIKKKFKTWIDENWDHKMILREDDPLVSVLRESDQSVFSLRNNPTSEILANHLFEIAKEWGFPIQEVRIWETSKQAATYKN